MPHANSSAISPAELEARLRLHLLPELGPSRFHTLISAFGSASSALGAPACAWRSLGLPPACAEARRSPQVRDAASAALAWLERPAQHLLMWDSPDYPALLAEIAGPPPLLFVAGNVQLLDKPQLAMVGSRRASRPGLETAEAFARSLAAAGFVITSGLALGIDAAAHRGALAVKGGTVGVLGTGLEKFYPQRNAALGRAMIEQGSTVVSEFPLDCPPQAANFPRRNRIISGLALGVLVVEASPASGSLITARLAAEQGREVYAIPGSIHHPGAKGCHQLIRDGAVLVETVQHILEALRGWQALPAEAPAGVAAIQQQMTLGPPGALDSPLFRSLQALHPLMALLHAAPHSSEALAHASGWPLPKVLATLTELELEGQVVCENGRWVGCAQPHGYTAAKS